ncbi:hypothetical protein V6N13_020804 [Hibiscus sabdariffa]
MKVIELEPEESASYVPHNIYAEAVDCCRIIGCECQRTDTTTRGYEGAYEVGRNFEKDEEFDYVNEMTASSSTKTKPKGSSTTNYHSLKYSRPCPDCHRTTEALVRGGNWELGTGNYNSASATVSGNSPVCLEQNSAQASSKNVVTRVSCACRFGNFQSSS